MSSIQNEIDVDDVVDFLDDAHVGLFSPETSLITAEELLAAAIERFGNDALQGLAMSLAQVEEDFENSPATVREISALIEAAIAVVFERFRF